VWVTAILLVRQAGDRDRIVYDLDPGPVERGPQPPPQPPGRWERATKGKSKRRGETWAERAERGHDGRPRAAA
jgi:hypothetical protein